MARFAVHHVQKPAWNLSRELELGLEDPMSGLKRSIDVLVIKDSGGSVEYPAGLEYRCHLDVPSIVEALTISKDDCEQISAMMSLMTGISGGPVTPLIAYPLDEAKVHQFYQYHQIETGEVSTGVANTEAFSEFADKLFGLKDPDVLGRLNSGLRFYRKAEETDQPLQRFLLLWLAVEYLDYALRNMLGVITGRKCAKCGGLLKCPKCGRLAETPTTAGLKEFVRIHMSARSKDFSEAVKLRNELMHQATDLTLLSHKIALGIPFLIELYQNSLAFILDHKAILNCPRDICGSASMHLNLNVFVKYDSESVLAENTHTIPRVQIGNLDKCLRYDGSGNLLLEGKMDMNLKGVKACRMWEVVFTVVSHGAKVQEFKTGWKHNA